MALKNITSSNTIIFTIFLLFLCPFSSSFRIPFDSSEINTNNINQDEKNNIFSLDDINNDIFLPSQNLPEPDSEPNSHPATLIQYEPSQSQSQKTNPHDTDTKTQSLEEESQPLPLTVFRFSPINRKRPLPLSFRHHHHTHRHYNPLNNRHVPRRDVVITKIDENDVASSEFPAEWMRYRENDINECNKAKYLKRIYNRYHQRRQEQAENEIKDSESSVVKRIRKFLNA